MMSIKITGRDLGFGISGAVKVTVETKLMNLGTNALAKIGKKILGATAEDRLRFFKEDLYKKVDLSSIYSSMIDEAYHLTIDYVWATLLKENKVQPVSLETEKLEGLEDNIIKRYKNKEMDQKEIVKALCEVIPLDPYAAFRAYFLVYFYSCARADVEKFLRFLGAEVSVSRQRWEYGLKTRKPFYIFEDEGFHREIPGEI
jgi:hypothetical protein